MAARRSSGRLATYSLTEVALLVIHRDSFRIRSIGILFFDRCKTCIRYGMATNHAIIYGRRLANAKRTHKESSRATAGHNVQEIAQRVRAPSPPGYLYSE